jgi:hypothetical protein
MSVYNSLLKTPKKTPHVCLRVGNSEHNTHTMQFPETWTSQTRPIDPDTSSKRKRRNKPKVAPTDTTPTDQPSVEEGQQTKPSKRICIDTSADVGILPTTQCRKPEIRHTNTPDVPQRNAKQAMEPSFKPVAVNITTDEVQVPIVLEIHSLISRLPYAQMLNQVFTDDASCAVTVPVVTRAYEESYMREVIHAHERPCISGESCECNFIDPMMPFIGVEFTMNDNNNDNVHQMCVLCSRRLTQELFFNMVYNGHRFRGTIQRYGNLCNQPLEYAREAMLISPSGSSMQNMPLPMVAHQRHRYSVFSQNGTLFLRQHKVFFEDFRLPASSSL